jgi:NitT/TauT family transport system ATP-binding protein
MTAIASQEARFPDPARPQIVFSDVTLDLGGKTILKDISLDVKAGEFLCIVGASGCGKTSALRLAAGLYQPTSGSVTFDGKPILSPRRDIAIVFQDYGKALLPCGPQPAMSRWRWRPPASPPRYAAPVSMPC